MKILQKTIARLVSPATLERMKAETNQWQLRCLNCGATRSLWDAGGIRYGKVAAGNVSTTFANCRECGTLARARVERVDRAEAGSR